MSLAHLENARAMHLENESLELVVSREFSRKGVDFSHKKRLAQSHRVRGMLDRMRTNARKLVRLFFSLFLSYFFFAFFKTTNTPLCCVVLRVVVVVVRYNMPCSKGENNARVRLKTTDLFSYEQTRTKNNRKRTMKTSTEAEKRKSNALAALGRNRSKRFTEQ